MPWPRAITAAVEPRIGQRRLWPRCSLLRSVPRDHDRSEEHTSELQSQSNLVCRLLLEKKKKKELYEDHVTKKGSEYSDDICNEINLRGFGYASYARSGYGVESAYARRIQEHYSILLTQ